ncbi:MAG: hypothetical protein M1296_07110 [Chloroflexi bacterium]|nr:hypothetical protein [Chloroflexota bacterium]
MAQVGPGRVERIALERLALDDPFYFHCRGCGALCCTNEHLVLSPLKSAGWWALWA